MGQYADDLSDARRVMDFVDVDSDKWAQYARSKRWPLSWLYRRESRCLLRYERAVAARWDAGIFVSRDEADLFARLAPESGARVHGVYNGVDSVYFSPERNYENPYAPGGPVLVFTGAMDYWANVDAVTWFASEVFPRIRTAHPDARFYIVGARPSAAVQMLSSRPGVSVTGSVPDVRPFLAHAHAAVATLRIARGIQNKVLEALSMGRPVVATSAAAEGLLPCPNDALVIADDPAILAQQCLALLKQAYTGDQGRACVLKHYAWDRNLAHVIDLLEAGAR
jgi:sugar transferase (PEP-CTERM/EpsH1 system associated)